MSFKVSFSEFNNQDFWAQLEYPLRSKGFVQIHLYDCPGGAHPKGLAPGTIAKYMADLQALSPASKIIASHGVVSSYGAGAAPHNWAARRLLFPIYQGIYGGDDLICSLDGHCYNDGSSRRKSADSWIHCDDSHSANSDFCSFQSVVQVNPFQSTN